MSSAERADAPIYHSLVAEHGDVLTETREVAEQTQREITEALDFSALRVPPKAP
ncbi:hypothetical protein [Streptomyces sparsus]